MDGIGDAGEMLGKSHVFSIVVEVSKRFPPIWS